MSPEVCDPKRIYIGFEVKHLWHDAEWKMLLLKLKAAVMWGGKSEFYGCH